MRPSANDFPAFSLSWPRRIPLSLWTLEFGELAAGVTGTLDLQIALELTISRPGDGFTATFFLGNAAVPEPMTTALLVAVAAAGLALRRARRVC